MHQQMKNYILTLYPLMKESEYLPEFWKTLDGFYSGVCYSDMHSGSDATFYWAEEDNTKASPLFKATVAAFTNNINYPMLVIDPRFNQKETSKTFGTLLKGQVFETRMYDFTVYPLCFDNRVHLLSVNRYDQDSPLTKSFAFCASGTAVKVLQANVLPGVDKFDPVQGFNSNTSVEVSHCDPDQTYSSLSAMSSSLASSTSYGSWYYYTRGSGIFMNLGKTLVVTNKVDAMRVLNGFPATQAGYVQLAHRYGLDNYTTTGCDNDLFRQYGVRRQAFKNTDLENDSLCCEGGHGSGIYWCHNNPHLGNYQCGTLCQVDTYGKTNTPALMNNCGSGNKTNQCIPFGRYPGGDGASGNQEWQWHALTPLVPRKYTDPYDQLGWLLWKCVHGITDASEINQDLAPISAQQLAIYNRQVANLANGMGDMDGQVEKLITIQGLDTLQLAYQPNTMGSFSNEILGRAYQTSHPEDFSTRDPASDNSTQCTLVQNPIGSGDVLVCGKLTFAQPYSFPQWNTGDSPYTVLKCGSGPPDTSTHSGLTCGNDPGCPPGSYPQQCGPQISTCHPPVTYSPSTKILSGGCLDANLKCVSSELDMTNVPVGTPVNNCNGVLHAGPCS